MSRFTVSVSRIVNARPDDVFALFSDYREAHPAVLPKKYFKDLVVEEGGYGDGTVVRVTTAAFGQEVRYHLRVSVREPGRVLGETDINTGLDTTFTVDPVSNGQTRVTITTVFPGKRGIAGWLESKVVAWVARRMYREELENVAQYVQRKPQQASA